MSDLQIVVITMLILIPFIYLGANKLASVYHDNELEDRFSAEDIADMLGIKIK